MSNAETAAHVAFIVRRGAEQWRQAGTDSCPGPQLLTITGAVPQPGTLVELTGRATIGEVLLAAGVERVPGGVGWWLCGIVDPGDIAWDTDMEPSALDRMGQARGCGLLAVLPYGACALVETARIVRYLAGESAGQCGPCVLGLPVLVEGMGAVARGRGARARPSPHAPCRRDPAGQRRMQPS